MKRIAMVLTVRLDRYDEHDLIERDGPERAERTLEQRVGDAVIAALEDIGQDARVNWGCLRKLQKAVHDTDAGEDGYDVDGLIQDVGPAAEALVAWVEG